VLVLLLQADHTRSPQACASTSLLHAAAAAVQEKRRRDVSAVQRQLRTSDRLQRGVVAGAPAVRLSTQLAKNSAAAFARNDHCAQAAAVELCGSSQDLEVGTDAHAQDAQVLQQV
jgi:hypothetical protein